MGNEAAETAQALPYSCGIKVHRLMCMELLKFVDRISQIFPAIELARPRCSSGINALCSLNLAMEKAKLVVQRCTESSKLYLAITGNAIALRCERVCNSLELSLSQIQNLVPLLLATQISGIIDDLRNAKFVVDSTEEEASKAVVALLRQDTSASETTKTSSELRAFQIAATKLHITSPKALIIEKRSIKKLLDKFHDTEQRKENVLKYLLYLLMKYGKSIGGEQTENSSGECKSSHSSQYSACNSGLYDQCIELEQHGMVISGLHSQSLLAPLYSCETLSSNSIASLDSSLNDVPIQNIDFCGVSRGSSDARYSLDSVQVKVTNGLDLVSAQMNDDSDGCQSSASLNHGMNFGILSRLTALPWESQCKAVEDLKKHLTESDQACFPSNGSVVSLIRFLKHARDLYDVEAQRSGAQALLAFVSKCRSELPSLYEDLFYLLVSFLESGITEEALAIMEVLSSHRYCKSKIVSSGALPSILKTLDSQTRELQTLSVKILYKLSSNRDIIPHILSLRCIQKLIPLLSDSSLAGHCIQTLENLCDTEEGKVAVANANGCMASIAELLDTGTHKDQEHAVCVFLTLCSQRDEYCQMVMEEGVIPSLVNISVNGTTRGKQSATELLRLLRDIRPSDPLESSLPHAGPNPELSQDYGNCSKEKKPSSKAPGFFGWKTSIFSKRRSLALS